MLVFLKRDYLTEIVESVGDSAQFKKGWINLLLKIFHTADLHIGMKFNSYPDDIRVVLWKPGLMCSIKWFKWQMSGCVIYLWLRGFV